MSDLWDTLSDLWILIYRSGKCGAAPDPWGWDGRGIPDSLGVSGDSGGRGVPGGVPDDDVYHEGDSKE